MAGLKIGAQLIIWGQRPDVELPGVLDEVASLGYLGVEMAPAPLANYPDARGLFAARGLSLAGLHMGVGDVRAVGKALELLKALGGRYLIFSGAGGRTNAEEEYRRSSRSLQDAGRRAAAEGIRVLYHNHDAEIRNDALGMRVICEETEPEYVGLCIDVFWVQVGGLVPAEFVKQNLARTPYLHLKDGRDRVFLELGRGAVDLPAVMDAVRRGNVEWAVVEQDRTETTPKESMAVSRRYLKEKFGL